MTTPLQTAAQQVIDRWDSPLWKDQPHTGVYIAELRKALDAELQQAVEPVASLTVSNFRGHLTNHDVDYFGDLPAGTYSLYTHPAPPADDFDTWQKNPYTLVLQKSIAEDYVPKKAQQVAVPPGYALVPIEPTPAILDAMSSSGWKTACYKAMLAAAQGAKP